MTAGEPDRESGLSLWGHVPCGGIILSDDGMEAGWRCSCCGEATTLDQWRRLDAEPTEEVER